MDPGPPVPENKYYDVMVEQFGAIEDMKDAIEFNVEVMASQRELIEDLEERERVALQKVAEVEADLIFSLGHLRLAQQNGDNALALALLPGYLLHTSVLLAKRIEVSVFGDSLCFWQSC
jgi:hypothetical protein